MKSKFTFIIILIIACTKLSGQAPNLTFTPIITSGLVYPVFITNCNDDRLFIVEQDGRIRIKHPGVTALDTFLNIASIVSCCGEQGLLSMAFHPNYKQNGYFYVNYTDNNGDTRISRYSVNPADSNKALVNSAFNLLFIWQPYSNHNGGQIQFGSDGYLYIGTGDGGSGNDPGNRAQNKDSLLGKMLRIDVDNGSPYGIPVDNPFINIPNARDEIWAYGIRNPWRFSFDRLTGDMWTADVGQNAWEEIDFQAMGTGGGDNYGWRCWEGVSSTGLGGCAGVPNQHPPVYVYSSMGSYCSVIGGYVYRGAQYANLFGHYLFTDYCQSTFQSLWDSSGTLVHYNLASLNGGNSDVVSFGEDMYGELYCTVLTTGNIYKIGEAACLPVAYIADDDTLNVCDSTVTLSTPFAPDLIYNWTDSAGTGISSTNSVTVSQSGWYQVNVANLSACTNADTVYVNLSGPPPAVSFTGLDTFYCSYNAADTLIGIPAGGVFIGSGITDSIFNPDSAGIGIHVIHYNYTDGNGCVSSSSVIVRVDACVGLTEINGVEVSNVYPNPANNQLQINLNALQNQNAEMEINDLAGRVMQQKVVQLKAGKNNHAFNIQNLEAGIYLLNINIKGVSLSRKFVVEKQTQIGR